VTARGSILGSIFLAAGSAVRARRLELPLLLAGRSLGSGIGGLLYLSKKLDCFSLEAISIFAKPLKAKMATDQRGNQAALRNPLIGHGPDRGPSRSFRLLPDGNDFRKNQQTPIP
jgi:hypothetical protein